MSRWLSDRTLAHLRAVADEPDLSETKYRLIGPLGRGGMARVWEVEDTALGRTVALKVLDTPDPRGDLADRLVLEARILARLEHPGIVPVHDVGRLPDGRVFHVMKLVRGRRLDELLDDLPDRDERLRIFERICEAVAFAHARGVLHRDLKPANIMIGEFGEVLVMDWGVGKVLGAECESPGGPDAEALEAEVAAPADGTHDGTRIGTPGFMAPEQERGQAESIDARTDVFGLGGILHVLLFGETPARTAGAEPSGRTARRETAEPHGSARATLREVPRALRAIASRALAPDPAARYAGAAALADDIRRFRAGLVPVAYREPLHERAARVLHRYRVPIALVVSYIIMRALLIVLA